MHTFAYDLATDRLARLGGDWLDAHSKRADTALVEDALDRARREFRRAERKERKAAKKSRCPGAEPEDA